MTATAPAHAPSRTSTDRGRHGVAAITAAITTTVSSLFVSSRPAPGASLHSSEIAFHAVQAASRTSAASPASGRTPPARPRDRQREQQAGGEQARRVPGATAK